MSKPAARLTDMHLCPMQTPAVVPIPHVGGPIVSPGEPRVLIGGVPAACVGDMCVCVGPPDVIVMGSFTVMMGGRPAARMGDMTAHGGSIVGGYPTVMIGDAGGGAGSVAAFTMGSARAKGAAFTRTDCQSQGVMKGLAKSPALRTADRTKKSWVEIELKDQKNRPVAHERYRVVPPGGAEPVEGFLDAQGFARVDGIDPGTCVISFPDLDAASWKPESGPAPRPVKPVPPPAHRKPKVNVASAAARVRGRPRILAGSAKATVILPGPDERPSVQRTTISVVVRTRPGVQRKTIEVAGVARPTVKRDTIEVTLVSRPGFNRQSINVVAARARPSTAPPSP